MEMIGKVWDFIQDQLLGMRWLNALVGDALGALGLDTPLRGSGARRADGPGVEPAAAPKTVTAPVPHALGIRPRELADALANGTAPALLDVREADEVAGGMLPGARHVPLAEVLADPGGVAASAASVVVICAAGARAQRAADALLAAGIYARVLLGGMQAWESAAAVARA